MPSPRTLLSLSALACLPCIAEEIDFNRDIRPLLTTQCTACHGGVKEAGGISFVFREKALAIGESGNPTIVPGKPEESELMRRVTSTDPDMVMPQPVHGPPLKEKEVAKLRQWIQEGAKWEEHWAFEMPVDTPPPAVKDKAWPRNRIDEYVLARLEKESLEPSPQAEPGLLLRRLSLDVIGLPPTLAELDAFETAWKADPEAAWQKEIDRLLDSPHYGEKWAANWLDLARYADTEGLGLDRPRTAWPFRDWVIRAYNSDLPFDQFTIKQIAGDLLPNPTLDDLIATNFHRHTQANAEGGTDDEEFRTTAVMDRVATTWETWQGITMGCVQCHSHPYDPIEHEEYFTSLAFFNNARDADLDPHFPVTPIPKDPARGADFARGLNERSKLRQQLHRQQEQLRSATSWLAPAKLEASSKKVKLVVRPGDGTPEFHTDSNVPNGSVFDLTLSAPAEITQVSAIRVELLPVDPDTAIHTPEWGAILSLIQLQTLAADGTARPVKIARVIGDEPEPFYDPNESLRAGGSGWGPYTKIDRPRSCVLILDQPLPLSGQRLRLSLHQTNNAGGAVPLVAKRGRVFLTAEPAWSALPSDPAFGKAIARIAQIDGALAQHSATTLPTIQSMPTHLERPTHLFVRGNWLEKDKRIDRPGIPKLFGRLPENAPADRLAFAKWLVSAENPLTSRVVVNRLWEQIFGFGLVETLEDFGSSGTKPSHPELLDHLALRFRDHHRWSQKAMLREILSSATYRQSSATTADAYAADPQNRLLARGPRVRLSAEAVRDHGLVSSGLFAPTLFGPPVFPPMPPGGWTPFKSGEKWNTPEPGKPDRYRRAIYTYTKRSNPYPGFATFDAPPRDLCTKRRVLSNTPLQSLEALNSPAHAEFAQGLARRMKNEFPGDLAAKLAAGHRVTTSRLPNPERLAELTALYQELHSQYTADPKRMAGMAGTPDGAALTVLASVLLNLDEAIVK
ncbi:MAG: PSD1 and planctomycete cytochrome C domain-containing protein [Akkermansiaceae bacterium]|nr:PSD1 and planctomycete cytochrome C domain-containing protein [Akkermansiaceae bacterium]